MKRDLFLILFGVCSGAVFSGLIFLLTSPPRGQPLDISSPPTPYPIWVDISGCINKPGIYELPHDSRIIDAVNAASGLTTEADIEQVNLSKRIHDEDKIFIPSAEETFRQISSSEQSYRNTQETDMRLQVEQMIIDINRASIDELQNLPGIGQKKAEDIVNYRISHGFFDKIEDIQKVSGIGPSIYAEIKDFITVEVN